jgi:hypothetical protein
VSDHSSTQKNVLVRLKLLRSGGFLGSSSQFEIEVKNLSASYLVKLDHLVANSKVMELPEETKTNEAARDAYSYVITVETDGGKKQLTYDDTTLPPSLQDLVGYIIANAKA